MRYRGPFWGRAAQIGAERVNDVGGPCANELVTDVDGFRKPRQRPGPDDIISQRGRNAIEIRRRPRCLNTAVLVDERVAEAARDGGLGRIGDPG